LNVGGDVVSLAAKQMQHRPLGSGAASLAAARAQKHVALDALLQAAAPSPPPPPPCGA